jgi:hypothetical protein
MKQTNKQKVEDILKQKGWVDNFYCIDNRISLRLSDIIMTLKEEGWEFDDEKSGYLNPNQKKNWYYVAKKSPYRTITRVLGNGETITTLQR